ncbi:MAG TPA: endonuclease/exonuclease/phosphatase family protein [Hyphomicrobiaceae bacterium]|nr:endonuclease/exonuclease/phosphatase family protein [Hyphomicrobiaceae bacterium]
MIVRVPLAAAVFICVVTSLIGLAAPLYPTADFLNHFRPFLAAGSAVLLVASLAVRSRRLALASTALLVLNAALLALPLLWSAAPVQRHAAGQALAGTDGQEIKLVTFNTAYRDPKAIARFLLREDADIVVLQEIGARQGGALRQLLSARYPYSHLCTMRRCGAAIFSRRAWAEAGHDYQSAQTPETIWVRFDDPELGRLRVIGVHLSLPFRSGPQAHQIDRLIALARKAREPVILAGDFNMTPWSYRLQRLLATTGLRRHAMLLRSWPTDGQFRLPLPVFLIDHVLTTQDITSVAIRTGPKIGSDHLPVIARMQLRKRTDEPHREPRTSRRP